MSTAELTQEEIVTKLLISDEILEPTTENFYTTKSIIDRLEENYNSEPELLSQKTKYSFIKGSWNI